MLSESVSAPAPLWCPAGSRVRCQPWLQWAVPAGTEQQVTLDNHSDDADRAESVPEVTEEAGKKCVFVVGMSFTFLSRHLSVWEMLGA